MPCLMSISLKGPSNVYEALKQRISSVFDFYNPSGVKIRLDEMDRKPIVLLEEIGNKLKTVYEEAYEHTFNDGISPFIQRLAQEAYERRFGDIGYIRLFVQGVIKAFHMLRKEPKGAFNQDTTVKLLEG